MATTPRSLIVGVDVGGTNTDSVLLDTSQAGTNAVVASHKAPTTSNVTLGVLATLRALLEKSAISPTLVTALAIGTTHFINAIVERDSSRVEKVAVLRLASHNFSTGTPPFTDWPSGLKNIIHGHSAIIPGGCHINGALITEIDENAVREQAKIIKASEIKNIVIVGIGSPSDEKYHQEEQVRDILKESLGDGDETNIICSRHIAGSGLLARENASILNAAILNFAQRTIRSFIGAMNSVGLQCPLYLTSNAGHLLPFSQAMRFPIHIFSSGTTNSIRGAAFLAGSTINQHGCIVVDIGGTTTDVGYLLKNGYPRLATSSTDIAGVKINLEMPSTESIGLGGGSILHVSQDSSQKVLVGPDSVGHNLLTDALCFGGKVATATDVAVARGVDIGIENVAVDLSPGILTKAEAQIKRMLDACIDRTKSSPEPCTVILVGGGSILCPAELKGVNKIVVPEYSGVANAIGAAMAKVSGNAEMIVKSSEIQDGRDKVVARAVENCISKGGEAKSVTIIKEEITGVPYTQGQTLIRVEVACPANHALVYQQMLGTTQNEKFQEESFVETKKHYISSDEDYTAKNIIDIRTYRPNVSSSGVWTLSEIDIRFMAIGCYILGCGGGGSPYEPYLHLRQLLSENETVTMVSCEDLNDEDVIPPLASIGTPAVSIERPGGDGLLHSLRAMAEELDVRFDKLLATEIGGGNGLAPMVLCSSKYYGIPLVDGDLMGRAYPNFEMVSQYISAKSINELLPVTISSGTGQNIVIPANQVDETSAGIEIRDACFAMGFAAGATGRPLSGKEIRAVGIPNTHSLAWRLGRAVSMVQEAGSLSMVHKALIEECGGPAGARRIFRGKICGVESSITKTAHTLGKVRIERLGDDEIESDEDGGEGLSEVVIPFMNENLAIIGKDEKGEEIVLATVPDLIFLLDASTGEAIGCQEYRYGVKVTVMIMAPHPVWTSQRGLEVAGPAHFELPYEYTSSLKYTKPKSVIEEFRAKDE